MPESWDDLITKLRESSTEAALLRRDAKLTEVARSEWVSAEIATRAEAGTAITRAEKDVHALPEYRERQRQVIAVELAADMAERAVRILEYEAQYLIACKESEAPHA